MKKILLTLLFGTLLVQTDWVAATSKEKASRFLSPGLESLANKHCCLGWREWIRLPQLIPDRILAKIDSGAKTSSLHAENITFFERNEDEWVRFDLSPKRDSKKPRYTLEAKVLETRNVKSSNGKVSIRPVIETEMTVGGQSWPIEITLVDRSLMGYRMLIGRKAINGRFLVDSEKSYLQSEKIQTMASNPTMSKNKGHKLIQLLGIKNKSIPSNLVKSLLLLLLLLLLRFYLNHFFADQKDDESARKKRLKSLSNKALILICLLGLLIIWFNEFRAISIYLMAVSVAFVFTMREAIKNIHGGIHIMTSSPFKIGEYIEIKDQSGEVLDINLMSTKIINRSQQLVTLPNSLFLSSLVINKSYDRNKSEKLELSHSFKEGKDWKKREKTLMACALEALKKHGLSPTHDASFIEYNFASNERIRFSINLDVPKDKRERIKSEITRNFLDQFYSREKEKDLNGEN